MMMKKLIPLLMLVASPAMAEEVATEMAKAEPFFSLRSTEFVVTIAFLAFIGLLIYLKIPALLTGLLDKRAEGIKASLDEAKALRDEAQKLLASYERKQREVQDQSARIVAQARDEAAAAAAKAKDDLKASIARRVKTAEDQIASAEAAAVRAVRDRAVTIAVAAAGDVMAKSLTAKDGDALIDGAITLVEARMH